MQSTLIMTRDTLQGEVTQLTATLAAVGAEPLNVKELSVLLSEQAAAEMARNEAVSALETAESTLDQLHEEYDRLGWCLDVSNTSLTPSLAESESSKARIASVLQTFATGSPYSSKARKAFEEGSKSELENARKWITARFSRGANYN